eukprot:gene6806-10972_t
MIKVLLIVLISFVALSMGRTQKCPKFCDCPLKSDPVCGASKRTHINSCYAACFKDLVVSKGACPQPKCTLGYKTKTECHSVQMGKYGSKKKCCTSKRTCNGNSCTYTKKRCRFVGKSVFEYPKSKCFVVKNKQGRTRRCCFWKRRCVGSKCRNVNKVCENVGTFHHHKGCIYKKKKNIRYCCKQLDKTCIGKACELKCKPVSSKRVKRKCHWNKLSKGCKRRSCCYTFEKCTKTSCKLTRRCQFVGGIICHKLKRSCAYKKVSPTCKQLKCCNKVKKCHNHKCRVIQTKCRRVGSLKCTTRHKRCKIVKRRRHVRQLRCCTFTRHCNGKRCRTYNNYCRWKGFRVTNRFTRGCRWRQVGKTAKRKQCCKVKKICKRHRCKKTYYSCVFKGPVLAEKENIVCKWKPYGKYGTRQRCCSFLRKCYGAKCQNTHIRCRYTGEIIVKKPMHRCKFKTYQRRFKRQQCCTWTKYCYGNTCKRIRQSCKWKGTKVKRSRKCSCKWKKYKGGEKQRCCCVFRKCRGKTCKVLRRKCKWVGKLIKTRTIKKGCHWKVYGKNIKRKRCCHKTVKCVSHKGKKKCAKVIHSCKWTGPEVKNKEFIRCRKSVLKSNAHHTVYAKKCCRYLKHCYGKFCKTTHFPCYRVGHVTSVRKFKRCSMKKFRNGKKSRCCHFVRICKGRNCKTKRYGNCKFVGNIVTKNRKCSCKWASRSRHASQRRCCCKTRKCVGIKCFTSKAKCNFVGKIVRRKWVHNCRIMKYGRGTRKKCCQIKRVCKGKKCRNVRKHCKWVGRVSTENARVKCKWHKVNRYTKQKVCCVHLKSCVGRFCQTTKTKCKILHKVTFKRRNVCTVRKTKKGCRKTRCCSWTKKCHGSKCRIAHKRCYWRGKSTCVKRKCSCKWTTRRSLFARKSSRRVCKQKRCYCPKVVCYGRRCVKHNPRRFWIGKKICNHSHKKCHFVKVGVSGKQKRCCHRLNICKHKKCRKSFARCKNVGPIYTTSSEFKCSKVSVGRNKVQRQCCLVIKKCKGKRCSSRKTRCKRSGKILPKGCQWKSKKVCAGLRSTKHKGFSCKVSGDPHFETFTKKQFNSYVPGDFVLVEKPSGFTVHSRTKQWSTSSVVVKLAVKAGNTIVETINSNQFLVNKKLLRLKKTTHETKDLLIERLSKNRVLIKSKAGDYVDIRFFNAKTVKDSSRKWHQNQFLNAIVNVKSYQKASGLCMHQTKRATGLFHVAYAPSSSTANKKNFTGAQKKHAENVCKRRGVKKDQLSNCSQDFLNTHDIQFVKAARKIDQDAKKK